MVRWKRLFYYLMINIMVSACATVSVLALWERYRGPVLIDPVSLIAQEAAPTSVLTSAAEEMESTATPEPVPTRALSTYQVAAGDTLGGIALKYDISLAELMEINGMTDPDALGSGQILFVPYLVETTVEQEPEENFQTTTTPVLSTEGGEAQVIIGNVVGAGDLPTERVRIEKKGEEVLSLAGWRLVGESGSVYVFPQLSLYKDATIDVYSRKGVNSAVALYWGLEQAAWKTGETIILFDEAGISRSVFAIP